MEKNIELKENERIDDLEYKDLKIIQNKDGFCFGIDSILLSDFAKNIKKGAKVLDLGTGTGIIATLLCGKTELSQITGIEIQEEVSEMAKRSIKLNHLEGKFKIIQDNIVNLNHHFEKNTFDVIVTNPPYKKKETGVENVDKRKNFAVLELDVRKLVTLNKDAVKIIPTSKYQSVSIDYNFLADKSLPYQTIENKLNEFKSSHIVEHSLKDIYTNDESLNGKISYTINVIVTPKNKTLESTDIEKFSNNLISHMAEIGLTLRS